MSTAPDGFVAEEAPTGLQNVVTFLLDGPASASAYQGPWAKVTFSCGITIPTGQYQNARPMVSIEVPCHPTKIQEAYEFAAAWAEERLVEVRAGIEGALNG